MKRICIKLDFFVMQKEFKVKTESSELDLELKFLNIEKENIISNSYKTFKYRKFGYGFVLTVPIWFDLEEDINLNDINYLILSCEFRHNEKEKFSLKDGTMFIKSKKLVDLSQKPDIWTNDENGKLIQCDYESFRS